MTKYERDRIRLKLRELEELVHSELPTDEQIGHPSLGRSSRYAYRLGQIQAQVTALVNAFILVTDPRFPRRKRAAP